MLSCGFLIQRFEHSAAFYFVSVQGKKICVADQEKQTSKALKNQIKALLKTIPVFIFT